MKIRTGDTVIVCAGKDRGKSGKVLKVFPKKDLVLVEGVNILKKHQRARRAGQLGQIIDRATPMHVSNVAIGDPKSGKPARIGYKYEENKKIRISRKSNTAV